MSFRPMMEFSNESPKGNALRFATHAEAWGSANDLLMRWTIPVGCHVDESDDPVSHVWTDAGTVSVAVHRETR